MLGLLKRTSGDHQPPSHQEGHGAVSRVRRQLPERSRGLLRLRLKPDAVDPPCISCTFCEQICPSVAIRIIHENRQPEKVWSLDVNAGPMLSYFNRGEKPLGMELWPEKADPLLKRPTGTAAWPARFSIRPFFRRWCWPRPPAATASGWRRPSASRPFYDQLRPGRPVPKKL